MAASEFTQSTTGLCECGCGQVTRIATRTSARLGVKAGEHRRFVIGHQGRKTGPRYLVDEATGCWNWTGCISTTGYGSVHRDGRTRPAHRLMFEEANGPIPDEKVLDHLCRNRRCVNPDHLRVVSDAENIRCGLKTKLSKVDVAEIRRMAESGVFQKVIGERFGISQAHVSRIVLGQRWRDDTEVFGHE